VDIISLIVWTKINLDQAFGKASICNSRDVWINQRKGPLVGCNSAQDVTDSSNDDENNPVEYVRRNESDRGQSHFGVWPGSGYLVI
jgi:hypothetical protein